MEKSGKKALLLLFLLVFFVCLGIFGASYLYHFFVAVGKARASGHLTSLNLPELSKVGNALIFNADKIAHPKAFKGAIMLAGGGSLLLFTLIASKFSPKRSLYGDARFATMAEVKEAGLLVNPPKAAEKETLFAQNAIIVGKMGGRYIGLDGQEFAYLAAPTRSGKGTGVVNVVLLSYNGSIVVLDIKKELFNISAAKRLKNGHKVFLFDPYNKDGKTARWNPLSYIRRDDDLRIDDIQKIAQTLIPPQGGDQIWTDAPRNLFTGLTLYLLDKQRRFADFVPTVRGVLDLARQINEQDAKGYFATLLATKEFSVSQQTKDLINSTLKGAEATFSSILITLTTCLSPFGSELVAKATSADDFDLRNVRKEKTTIYFGVEPADLKQSSKIINLFYTQLINENTRVLPQDDENLTEQCLLLMDEGTAPGNIEILPEAVSYMAGYNMRMLLIVQSPAQLRNPKLYGEHGTQTILSNCALKILYKPNDYKDADEYSKLLGNTTVKERTSKNMGRGGNSQTETQNSRALMLPQELVAMSKNRVIIRYDGIASAIDATKNCHWKDKNFKDFAKWGRLKMKSINERNAAKQGLKTFVANVYDNLKKNYPDEYHGMYFAENTRRIMLDEWDNTLKECLVGAM